MKKEHAVIQLPVTAPNEAQKKAKHETFFEWMGTPAIILSILTAAAYLTGIAFHQEYFTYFQVNHGFFPKSSSDYFLFAYRAILEILPAWLNFAGTDLRMVVILFFALVSTSIIIKIGGMLDNSERMKRVRARANKNKIFALIGELLLAPTIGFAAVYYIPIFIAILMIIPVGVGSFGGQKAAKADMERFEKGCQTSKGSDAFCTQIIDEENIIASGFIIDISDKYVALIENGNAKVVPIKEREFSSFKK
ncbi:hypothetical protein [Noviherbaspirillum sp.]|jgi:hypothetical protein|uniref:hypothetical protein n=1 Tax=Noviherbaspirillum sp. TaxID=1926288 RepID=UPI0025CFD9BF|nr:hypothetical protein [Noviherbaspirillum sp.]